MYVKVTTEKKCSNHTPTEKTKNTRQGWDERSTGWSDKYIRIILMIDWAVYSSDFFCNLYQSSAYNCEAFSPRRHRPKEQLASTPVGAKVRTVMDLLWEWQFPWAQIDSGFCLNFRIHWRVLACAVAHLGITGDYPKHVQLTPHRIVDCPWEGLADRLF